jgi:hypothetical protein
MRAAFESGFVSSSFCCGIEEKEIATGGVDIAAIFMSEPTRGIRRRLRRQQPLVMRPSNANFSRSNQLRTKGYMSNCARDLNRSRPLHRPYPDEMSCLHDEQGASGRLEFDLNGTLRGRL